MIENCLTEEREHDPIQHVDVQNMSLTSLAIDQYRIRLTDYGKIVASIDQKLDHLQELTEEIFLKIGDKLPSINQSLHRVDSEANGLLGYFERESGFLGNDRGESSDLYKLNQASKYLIKVADDQGDAFLKMSEMMKRISHVKDSIESIREFSVEMEMLSLNAAIVAIKAGDAGRTLNPITIELKKMANSAISLIDDIVNNSEQLTEKYRLFQELSETQAKSCKVDAGNISVSLTEKYKNMQVSVLDLVERINQIIMMIGRTRVPIGNVMNMLQVQDIVKQCTDHVRISLNESLYDVRSSMGGPIENSFEQILDGITYHEKVPLLCIQLLDDIDARLHDSLNSLTSEFIALRGLLRTGTCEHRGGTGVLTTEYLSETEEGFNDIEKVVMETAIMIQKAADGWEQLWSTAVSLESTFEAMEKQFVLLKKSTNFHLINIPIKIEVARNNDLSKDGELSERVEGLAEYISTEMKRAHKEIVQDYQFLDQMVDSMNRHKKNVEEDLNTLAYGIDDLLQNFFRAKEQVKATFSFVCDHAIELGELIQASLNDLDNINQLVLQNSKIKEELEKLAFMATEAKVSIQSALGLDSWELRDEKLKTTIDKFTVLGHKKIAESLYDISVEDGNQEGEIILF